MNNTVSIPTGGGYEHVRMTASSPVPPRMGEILVRIYANSLNYHDLTVVSGRNGPKERRIPMADGAGQVIAVGPGVSEFSIGDHVISTFFPTWHNGKSQVEDFSEVPGDGIDGYAREWVTCPAQSFTHAPRGWSYAEAATLPTAGVTAWHALMSNGRLKPGDSVLIQGTGGVSLFALQFAKMTGATVIAISSCEPKLQLLKKLGADHGINYRTSPDWGRHVQEIMKGKGVDHIVDVGGIATLEQSMLAAGIGGHISVIGVLTGVAGHLSIVPLLMKQLQLKGILVGSRKHQQDMVTALNANPSVRPVIDKQFPLEDMVDAFRYQESNQHVGKIILDINGH